MFPVAISLYDGVESKTMLAKSNRERKWNEPRVAILNYRFGVVDKNCTGDFWNSVQQVFQTEQVWWQSQGHYNTERLWMHQIEICLLFWNSLLKLCYLSYLSWHMNMNLRGENYGNRMHVQFYWTNKGDTDHDRIQSSLLASNHQYALKDMCPNQYCLGSEFRFGPANVTYLHHCVPKSFKPGRSHFSVVCPKNVCKRPMFEPIYFDRHFQRLFLVWLKSCRRIIDS